MRPTWRGIGVFGTAIVLGGLGYATAIPELIGMAIAAVLAVLVAAVMTAGGARLDIDAWVPARIERGTHAEVRLRWRGETRRRSGLRFATRRGLSVTGVRWGQVPGEATIIVPTAQRGPLRLGPWICSRSDPWGLFTRHLGDVDAVETLITPLVHPLPLASLPMAFTDHSGVDDAGITAFASLREYVVGDEMRHIHWRSSAKAGTLMTRQYIDVTRPHMTLVLVDDPRAVRDPDDFEDAVDLAASVAAVAISAGFEVTLRTTSGESLKAHSSGAALESLATVGLHQANADRRLQRLSAATTLVVTGHGARGWWDRIPNAGVMRP
jgi:uncharacterized protein (DUF58 family)